MDALNENTRFIDASDGTPESVWLHAPGLDAIPAVDPQTLVPAGSRAVVVAPHPDDEVLSVGGLMAELSAAGREICVVAVTDGDASHPGSSLWSASELACVRRHETRIALRRLGLQHEAIRLGLPDGGLQARREELADQIAALLQPNDVVFCTWRLDGHPDHDATGEACATATSRAGAKLIEVPVWAWHWSRPGDPRLPWARALRLPLGADAVRRKREAVTAFRSQLEPDVTTGAPPILRASTVARASRPFEIVFA
ncbi:PIG-L family deacetylase [Xylophilus sp. GOD-11R]|uniref:PIG-L deacetylase family protein n=1 Tax=Xylophilus sp. GOD-11R TaxID=3089814 RepID=UPI00298BE48C|nr:PIG-L family deacetylase [Xylophilus sp. GOD-11R]WPB55757.1 PIG-L family deacetylase [Xylophilus sp. GOD-11R]